MGLSVMKNKKPYKIESNKSSPRGKVISFEHRQCKDSIFYPWMKIHDWANINKIKKRYVGHGDIVIEVPEGNFRYIRHEIKPISDLTEILTIYLTEVIDDG